MKISFNGHFLYFQKSHGQNFQFQPFLSQPKGPSLYWILTVITLPKETIVDGSSQLLPPSLKVFPGRKTKTAARSLSSKFASWLGLRVPFDFSSKGEIRILRISFIYHNISLLEWIHQDKDNLLLDYLIVLCHRLASNLVGEKMAFVRKFGDRC